MEEVHPLFPVLDIHETGAGRPPPVQVIQQAISLAASTSPRARPYLRLQASEGVLHTPRDFAAQISLALRTSLNLGFVTNKLVLLQTLAVLSLFTQLSGDRHHSAELTSRAVSYVHTAGLHLDTRYNKKDDLYFSRLFCCIWVLDRLNAAFNGRPVLMHERDYGRNLEAVFQQHDPIFQLLLKVITVLDKVIALYRPVANDQKEGWESNFPSYEDLLIQTGPIRSSAQLLGMIVPTCWGLLRTLADAKSLVATIEVLYHAVAMLTCRSQSLKEPLRSSASYVRQSLSASAIVNIVGTEFKGQLSMLPIVPYA